MKATNILSKIQNTDHVNQLTEFYDQATADYAFWSKGMNMHYGFMKHWSQFFNREAMLEQMNTEVFERLACPPNSLVIDAGCGTGATSRSFVKQNITSRSIGINVVESHIKLGKKINRTAAGRERISLIHADYQQIPLPNNVAEGFYAMESLCHSPNKAQVIEEAFRLLKVDGKIVITDCFTKNPTKRMGRLSRWAYKNFRNCWSVPHLAEIHHFKTMLSDAGFKNILIEDVRWKVAPSVLHSPFVVVRFLLSQLVNRNNSGEQTIKNLKAVLLSILIGLDAKKFGYYIVTASKSS